VVEHRLAKARVEGSNPFFRSIFLPTSECFGPTFYTNFLYNRGKYSILLVPENKELINMGADREGTYYLVREEALPDVLRKTIRAKELLKRGMCTKVNEAVDQVGLSRAAYYKYRSYIFPFNELSQGKIVTLHFVLEHKPGVLSQVLSRVAETKGNILTINQGIPLQGLADVSISIETHRMLEDMEELLQSLADLKGVRKTKIIGQE
jgi:chorismate mutase